MAQPGRLDTVGDVAESRARESAWTAAEFIFDFEHPVAWLIGLVVVAIGMSFGGMHGYAINPARDFGPRLFTVVAGAVISLFTPPNSPHQIKGLVIGAGPVREGSPSERLRA